VGCDRTLGEGNPWQCACEWHDAQAGGVVAPHRRVDKERVGSARFSVVCPIVPHRHCEERKRRSNPVFSNSVGRRGLSDHQHVEHDDRRQAQDYRPNAERPKNVLGRKTLLFRDWVFLTIHDAPAFLVLAEILIRVEF
jgi:hypothetical protein